MGDRKEPKCALPGYEATPHDWPEDWPGENGQYMHECPQCHARFIGHKRRSACKACAVPPAGAVKPEPPPEPPAKRVCPKCARMARAFPNPPRHCWRHRKDGEE